MDLVLRLQASPRPVLDTRAGRFAARPTRGRSAPFSVMKVNVGGASRPAPFGLAASDTDADNVALILPLEGTIAFETEAAAGQCERGSVLLLDIAPPFRIEAAFGELLRLSVPRSLARLTPAALSALHGMTVDGSTSAGRYLAKQIELLAEFEEEADRDHPNV